VHNIIATDLVRIPGDSPLSEVPTSSVAAIFENLSVASTVLHHAVSWKTRLGVQQSPQQPVYASHSFASGSHFTRVTLVTGPRALC
jgi:hypothetical protein